MTVLHQGILKTDPAPLNIQLLWTATEYLLKIRFCPPSQNFVFNGAKSRGIFRPHTQPASLPAEQRQDKQVLIKKLLQFGGAERRTTDLFQKVGLA